MKLTLVATCMFGLEKQVGEEIDALGLHRLETMDGRVTFEGEEADVARANLSLRCAERGRSGSGGRMLSRSRGIPSARR